MLLGHESHATADGLFVVLEVHPPDALQKRFFPQSGAQTSPVLLGRLTAMDRAWQRPERGVPKRELDTRVAAQLAREAFLAKLQRVQSRC